MFAPKGIVVTAAQIEDTKWDEPIELNLDELAAKYFGDPAALDITGRLIARKCINFTVCCVALIANAKDAAV